MLHACTANWNIQITKRESNCSRLVWEKIVKMEQRPDMACVMLVITHICEVKAPSSGGKGAIPRLNQMCGSDELYGAKWEIKR